MGIDVGRFIVWIVSHYIPDSQGPQILNGFQKTLLLLLPLRDRPRRQKIWPAYLGLQKEQLELNSFFTETTQHFALCFAFLLTAAIPRHDDGQRAEFIITARKWANFYLGSNIRSHSRIFFH